MNGRIYDPLLGRFLSADIAVQFPDSLQSYNRYSYVRNNPLTLVDPTGWWEFALFGFKFSNERDSGKRISSAVKSGNWKEVGAILKSTAIDRAREAWDFGAKVFEDAGTKGLPGILEDLGGGPKFPVPIGPAAPGLATVNGAVLAGEVATIDAAVISGTTALLDQTTKSDVKTGSDGGEVKERVYQEPKPGEPTKHGSETRSGSSGDISPAPTNGQAALDNSATVKIKPNGETRVGVDQANKEVVVLDRQQQTATQDVFHGHVPEVLKPEVRNVVKKEFPQVRVKKDGTWTVEEPKTD